MSSVTNSAPAAVQQPQAASTLALPPPPFALTLLSTMSEEDRRRHEQAKREAYAVAARLTAQMAPKKRGRPKGSADSKPRKKPAPPKPPPNKPSPRVQAAKNKMQNALLAKTAAQEDIRKAELAVKRAQKKLEAAKRAADKTDDGIHRTAHELANTLLKEPMKWNEMYKMLVAYKEREGHLTIKRLMKEDAKANRTDEQIKEYRTLYFFCSAQRKAMRHGTLEPYQQVLLDKIGFDWEAKGGPTGEKWFAMFEQYKEYERIHGNDAKATPSKKLNLWRKTQRAQYRNCLEGKTPALLQERIRPLEEAGFDFGTAVVHASWEERFEELNCYKEEHGHANVPWRWKENMPLAGWVNAQRNKFRDLCNGKHSNITAEQIQKLNAIGFRWSTKGKGRDIEENTD